MINTTTTYNDKEKREKKCTKINIGIIIFCTIMLIILEIMT